MSSKLVTRSHDTKLITTTRGSSFQYSYVCPPDLEIAPRTGEDSRGRKSPALWLACHPIIPPHTPSFFLYDLSTAGDRRFWGSGRPRAAGKPSKKMGGFAPPPPFRKVSRQPGTAQTPKIDDLRRSVKKSYIKILGVITSTVAWLFAYDRWK